MRLEPLGDQAAMVYCDDEQRATRLAAQAHRARPGWCLDIVQAYVSVAVYYDVHAVDFAQVADWLASLDSNSDDGEPAVSACHVVPCCYELGLDFDPVRTQTGLGREAVIKLHSGTIFTVYAIGFCPGFPYLGYLPAELSGVPRLASPRLRVEPGSVGLTGRQTGIYTEARPGGWNIIGRTPLLLVDVKDAYFPLRTGDRVQFRRIDAREFAELNGKRLNERQAPP
jgi:inhibitor of KinA